MTSVHVIVPDGFDDPARPSGGNTYDRRVCDGLSALGWAVQVRAVPGAWPTPAAAARGALARAVAAIPDGGVVLIDGLIASAVPEVLVPESRRLQLVTLVHMPLGDASAADGVAARECAVLSAASAVVTTSAWARRRLLDRYPLRPAHVHAAVPGVDAASLARGTAGGGRLLCVAAVAPHKGHDVLLGALTAVPDRSWHCSCVGSLDRDPGFVASLRSAAAAAGVARQVTFTGPLGGDALTAAYADADVLTLATHAETYGMVVTEALARGLPVIATDVGGLPEALGEAADGTRPGLLVPPNDPAAFAAAVRHWLGDAALRQRLRRAARDRRTTLSDWSVTSRQVARVLAEVAA